MHFPYLSTAQSSLAIYYLCKLMESIN